MDKKMKMKILRSLIILIITAIIISLLATSCRMKADDKVNIDLVADSEVPIDSNRSYR